MTTDYKLTSDAVKVAESIFKLLDDEAKIVARAERGEMRVPLKHMTKWQQEMQGRQIDGYVNKLWRGEGRQVLALHPDLVEEIQLSTSVPIFMEMMRTLPYINPLVIFAEPPMFKSWTATGEQEFVRMLGYFCYAGDHRNSPVGTHDPEARSFAILLLSEVLNAEGQVIDMESNRITLPFDEEAKTLEDRALSLYDRFHFADPDIHKRKLDPEKGQMFLLHALKAVVGSLMYLCSTTLDVEVVPRIATKRLAKMPVVRKPVEMKQIGWNFGPALKKAREVWFDRNDERGPGSGKPMIPHQRRCHFKTVWTGKGRTVPKLAFVSPYWTGRERLRLSDETVGRTVHPVSAR